MNELLQKWFQGELDNIPQTTAGSGAWKFPENMIVELDIDPLVPPEPVVSEYMGKKRIQRVFKAKGTDPETKQPVEKAWYVNVSNPIYREVVMALRDGADHNQKSVRLKVLRTGQAEKTRYVLVR